MKKKPAFTLPVERDGSLPVRIAALQIGETVTRSVRIDGDKANREQIQSALVLLRNAMNGAKARAEVVAAGSFELNTGLFFTKAHDVIAASAVTRVA